MGIKGVYFTAFGNDIERAAARVLYEDDIPFFNENDLQYIANLTNSRDSLTHDLFDHLISNELTRPGETRCVILQKCLQVCLFLLKFGSETCVLRIYDLKLQIESLQNYNSALYTASTLFSQVKGGNADTGHLTREVSKKLVGLMGQYALQAILKGRHVYIKDEDVLIRDIVQYEGYSGDVHRVRHPSTIKPGDAAFPKDDGNSFATGSKKVYGAKYGIEVMKQYENGPERYSDDINRMNKNDDDNDNENDSFDDDNSHDENELLQDFPGSNNKSKEKSKKSEKDSLVVEEEEDLLVLKTDNSNTNEEEEDLLGLIGSKNDKKTNDEEDLLALAPTSTTTNDGNGDLLVLTTTTTTTTTKDKVIMNGEEDNNNLLLILTPRSTSVNESLKKGNRNHDDDDLLVLTSTSTNKIEAKKENLLTLISSSSNEESKYYEEEGDEDCLVVFESNNTKQLNAGRPNKESSSMMAFNTTTNDELLALSSSVTTSITKSVNVSKSRSLEMSNSITELTNTHGSIQNGTSSCCDASGMGLTSAPVVPPPPSVPPPPPPPDSLTENNNQLVRYGETYHHHKINQGIQQVNGSSIKHDPFSGLTGF